ncbi:hypothetical protein RCH18_000034 [Flavobacterium sp. PL11]|uniref:RagB/SusD family nutrient uptake outer membrane protein n=1 Tax=Flavobacterium sp. PL11 TaxID=3071717 RepID=UPI002E0009E9|nr:hypothetical protein [Flavobacterium sp. PL11]
MKKNNFIKYLLFTGVVVFGVSCTDLDERIIDGTDIAKADPDAILTSAYNGLRAFQAQDKMFALNEVSTDIMMVPTRGGDWDDNGEWRLDHSHNWTPTSREGSQSWDAMLTSVYNCDLALAITGISPQKKAQALFLKAFYYYNVIDFYGQVPYREAGSSPDDFPKVWDSPTATAAIIAMLNEALPNLAEKGSDPAVANKDAARFLLAKIYMNKAVFDSPTHTGFNANNVANMNEAIKYIDQITAAGKTTLASDYWDNFKPTNHTSPEVIFTSKNINGVAMGPVNTRWFMGAHYNQTPGGWNGFSILGEFYDTFNPNDRRIKNDDAGIISTFGNPLGMQIGQQYAPGGTTKLKVREQAGGGDLIFDKDLPASQIISVSKLETAGVRPQKYIPDASNIDKPENDYVLFRYADALLMKAEALARGGAATGVSPTSATAVATLLSGRSGITTVTDLSTLAGIFKARGNELWLEGWRRNDMIRFGNYTTARRTMSNTDAYRVLMPIPAPALINPNIKQNPGY